MTVFPAKVENSKPTSYEASDRELISNDVEMQYEVDDEHSNDSDRADTRSDADDDYSHSERRAMALPRDCTMIRPCILCIPMDPIYPSKFYPPGHTLTADAVFYREQTIDQPFPFRGRDPRSRFGHSGLRRMIIHVAGVCLKPGSKRATAGCGVVIRPALRAGAGSISHRLENTGPDGSPQLQTLDRALLRAVISALQICSWNDKRWHTQIIIATDSAFLVDGATNWIADWVDHGWNVRRTGMPVQNQDLWKALLELVRECVWREFASDVLFWRIPKGLNKQAAAAARAAAIMDEVQDFALLMEPIEDFGYFWVPDK